MFAYTRRRFAVSLALLGCIAPGCSPWHDLFDGKSLDGWTIPEFGGEGEVEVQDGNLILRRGSPITGVTWTGAPVPRTNYEIEVRAAKLQGDDFFATLTFPVGKGSCSLVVGGWLGEVVGISCIDGMDADSNPTRKLIEFEHNRYYDIRVQVTDTYLTAWLDGEEIVRHPVQGHEYSVRGEMTINEPVGLASYDTESAFEHIRWRLIAPAPSSPVDK